MVIKRVLKTFFPKFGKDEFEQVSSRTLSTEPDDDTWEVSDYSDSEEKARKFKSKEDQDVAVFLKIAEQMSVKSLLFILQSHARSMHNVPEVQLQQALNHIQEKRQSSEDGNRSLSPVRQKLKVKKLRFAEILGGTQIRMQVQEIPHVDSFTPEFIEELWWTREEQNETRRTAIRVVKYFQQHKPQFSEAIITFANPEADDVLVEHHMKKLTQGDASCTINGSMPRGLEVHIIPQLMAIRSESIQRVLQEQEMCRRESCRGWDSSWERISAAYEKAALPCRSLASTVAACDHIEALKASISSWAPTSQNAVSAPIAIPQQAQQTPA